MPVDQNENRNQINHLMKYSMADGPAICYLMSPKRPQKKKHDKQEDDVTTTFKDVVNDNVRQEDLENFRGGLCFERGDVAPTLSVFIIFINIF